MSMHDAFPPMWLSKHSFRGHAKERFIIKFQDIARGVAQET
jgi:hypothetical protein